MFRPRFLSAALFIAACVMFAAALNRKAEEMVVGSARALDGDSLVVEGREMRLQGPSQALKRNFFRRPLMAGDLGAAEAELRKVMKPDGPAILEQMRVDEEQHAESALEAGGYRFPAPVRFGMSLLAKVMTKSTYRI